MTETAEAEDLTPQEAARTIDRARGYEEPLRRRTEGVTWMIWGVVTLAITLSYSAIPTYYPRYEATPWFVHWLITFGWPIVGVLLTFATWRIASLTLPSLGDRSLRSAVSSALWLPLVYLGIGAVFLLDVGASEASAIPIGIGLAWLTLGALDPFRATETGRRSLLVIGVVTLAGALAFAPFAASFPHEGWPAMRVLAGGLGGGAPFLVGLWQTLRG